MVVLTRAAEADLASARRWYEQQRPGLGNELIVAVDLALETVAEAPTRQRIVYRDLRRQLVRRFPYVIYYRSLGGHVLVVAVLHGAQDRLILRERI